MRKQIYFWVISLFLFASVQFCTGSGLSQIKTAGPSWNTFTNRDGTGLYHEIMDEIFSPLNARVIHKYTNANRGIHMVQKGLADIYICRSSSDEFPMLMLGSHQMYEGKFHAIYKKDRIKTWAGPSSLTHKKVVWRRGYYKASEFKARFIVFETDSGESAINQIVLDRGDFYIDDLNLIKESVSKSKFSINMNDYQIKPVGKRTYHPAFKASDRGKRLMEIYEKGMEELHNSGRLKEIFLKWGHPYPEFSSATPL